MADDFKAPTLDERIEEWRKRWNTKIGTDLFNNRKDDLKAMFRPKRWNLKRSEKLEGRLFRVKEYDDIHKVCPACHGAGRNFPGVAPGYFSDFKIEMGWYNERYDRFGVYQRNDIESRCWVMPGTIVFATGKYIERNAWWEDAWGNGSESRHIEVLTEKAIGYLKYEHLWPIKKSEVEKLKNQ